jgi:polar amino acid transport system permease protein
MKFRTLILGTLITVLLALGCWQVLASLRYHWNWPGILEHREIIIRGWLLTIEISAGALVATIIFGLLLAIGQETKEPVLRNVCCGYVELIRGTPLLTQLLLGYYVIAAAFHIDNKILAGIILLTSFEAAYMAEILRSGVASIERSQWDAAQALGLDRLQTWRFIILPQALRRVLPGMAGQCASLIKDSSLLSVLGIAEFAKQTDVAVSSTSSPLEGYLPMAVGYLILTLPLSWLARRLEMRWRPQ